MHRNTFSHPATLPQSRRSLQAVVNVKKGHTQLHQIHIHRLTGRAGGAMAGGAVAGGRAVGRPAGLGVGRTGVSGPTRGRARPGWQATATPGQALRASSRLIADALRPIRLATARTDNPTEAFAKPLADDQRVATTPLNPPANPLIQTVCLKLQMMDIR
jgi:hypothetical protein